MGKVPLDVWEQAGVSELRVDPCFDQNSSTCFPALLHCHLPNVYATASAGFMVTLGMPWISLLQPP